MSSANNGITGVGLGLRRELMPQLPTEPDGRIDFLEIAPENWLGIGGRMGASLRQYTERYPFVTHGLSLSLGGPAPLDENFVRRIKAFLDQHGIATYTEHLSACSDDGHLYDLMPVPFTDEGVRWVAGRIRRVMDILERRIAVENVSYYASPLAQMSEQEFILAVLEEADCDLLLDVNNAYVNSTNHRYDAAEFIRAMPVERIRYLHIAGHYREAEDLIVDTHGADIVDPVWQLLHTAYDHAGVVPTLLERDFNLPPLMELLQETDRIRAIQRSREAANARAAS